mgnify:CR=1 FL=1
MCIIAISRGTFSGGEALARRVAEQGSHLELMHRKGLYYSLWRQQGLERGEAEPALATA